MVDMEKVIKGLECCEDRIQCENCPYGKPRYIGIQGCTRELVHDALALLKEQDDEIKELRSIVEFWQDKALHT